MRGDGGRKGRERRTIVLTAGDVTNKSSSSPLRDCTLAARGVLRSLLNPRDHPCCRLGNEGITQSFSAVTKCYKSKESTGHGELDD